MAATTSEPATSHFVHRPGRVSTGPILVAVDGSEDSDLAARAAADLATGLKEELHVAHCWIPIVTPYGPAGLPTIDIELAYREPAQELLRSQVSGLEQRGARISGEHLLMGRAAEQIPDLATRLGAGLIVIGSRGLGAVKRLVLGSVSEGIVHRAEIPVLVVRGGSHAWPPAQILVGDDGSDQSRQAAQTAAMIARATGAALTIATVIPSTWLDAGSAGQARATEAARAAGDMMTREIADQLKATDGVAVGTSVLIGDPAGSLIAAAAEDLAPVMIAMGSRGLGAVQRLALGSVSTKVLRGTHGPVLITHSAR